jgi:hypothetical protein
MRLDFGFAILVAALSSAVYLPRPKPMSGPGFLQVPVTAVNKTSKLNKRQAGTPLYNPDFGLDYLVHSKLALMRFVRATDFLLFQLEHLPACRYRA